MGEYAEKLEKDRAAKKNKNALEKIKDLEESFPMLVNGVNETTKELRKSQAAMNETLQALVDLLGAESVATKIMEHRKQRQEANTASEKAALTQALEQNVIRETDKVAERTVITGVETAPDGTMVGAGYIQLPYDQFVPSVKEQLLGQSKGFKLTVPEGSCFELTGVYEILDPTPKQEEAAIELNKDLANLEEEVVQSVQE